MLHVSQTGNTKKYFKILIVGEIDISIYQYLYVKYRGGKFGEFGWSRSTVVFLNTNLSLLEVTLVVRRKYSY